MSFVLSFTLFVCSVVSSFVCSVVYSVVRSVVSSVACSVVYNVVCSVVYSVVCSVIYSVVFSVIYYVVFIPNSCLPYCCNTFCVLNSLVLFSFTASFAFHFLPVFILTLTPITYLSLSLKVITCPV